MKKSNKVILSAIFITAIANATAKAQAVEVSARDTTAILDSSQINDSLTIAQAKRYYGNTNVYVNSNVSVRPHHSFFWYLLHGRGHSHHHIHEVVDVNSNNAIERSYHPLNETVVRNTTATATSSTHPTTTPVAPRTHGFGNTMRSTSGHS